MRLPSPAPALARAALTAAGFTLAATPAVAQGTRVFASTLQSVVAPGTKVNGLAVADQGLVVWSCPQAPAAITRGGVFTAPFAAEARTYRLRASLEDDPAVYGECRIVVLAAQASGLPRELWDLVAEYSGRDHQAAFMDLDRLPFQSEAAWNEDDPAELIRAEGGSGGGAGAVHKTRLDLSAMGQVVGYGLPVPIQWDAKHAEADGILLSWMGSHGWTRLLAKGRTKADLRVTGRVEAAEWEALYQDAKAGTWKSERGDLPLKVRGLVPFAGLPGAEPCSLEGQGCAARFKEPFGLTLVGDPFQNLRHSAFIVSDPVDHVLHRVPYAGKSAILFGAPGKPGHKDAQGPEARFNRPTFLAARPTDPTGQKTVFTETFVVADSGNHTIRHVDRLWNVTTLAGTGKAGFTDHEKGELAQFNDPQGVAQDPEGNVYVADAGNFRIRKISPQGGVITLAGSGAQGTKDGEGLQASFTALRGLALMLPSRDLYAVDGHSIRRITPDGKVTTILGRPDKAGYCHELLMGPQDRPDQPCLTSPCAIAAAGARLYVSDEGNQAVRVVHLRMGNHQTWVDLQTLAGAPGQNQVRWGLLDGLPPGWSGQEPYATLAAPRGLALWGWNNLFVATDRTVSELSELNGPSAGRVFTIQDDGKGFQAKAGVPFRFALADANLAPLRFTWKVEFVRTGTTEQEAAAPKGGLHPHLPAPNLPFEVTFDQAGDVELRFRVVTDAGETFVGRRIVKVVP